MTRRMEEAAARSGRVLVYQGNGLFSVQKMKEMPNKIDGPNAGGPRQFIIGTPLAARVGQF